jgi:hypothetical protein
MNLKLDMNIRILMSVNIPRLMSMNSTVDVSEFKCRCRWILRLVSMNSNADIGEFNS